MSTTRSGFRPGLSAAGIDGILLAGAIQSYRAPVSILPSGEAMVWGQPLNCADGSVTGVPVASRASRPEGTVSEHGLICSKLPGGQGVLAKMGIYRR
jgi:hypothetical protein